MQTVHTESPTVLLCFKPFVWFIANQPNVVKVGRLSWSCIIIWSLQIFSSSKQSHYLSVNQFVTGKYWKKTPQKDQKYVEGAKKRVRRYGVLWQMKDWHCFNRYSLSSRYLMNWIEGWQQSNKSLAIRLFEIFLIRHNYWKK